MIRLMIHRSKASHYLANDSKSEIQQRTCMKGLAPEKLCKVICCIFLSLVVFLGGFIYRITLHIQMWHLNTPTNSSMASKYRRLGGLIQQIDYITHQGNASGNITSEALGTITSEKEHSVDETWVWAMFIVVIAPYVFATLSAFIRILFKTNKPLKPKITGVIQYLPQ